MSRKQNMSQLTDIWNKSCYFKKLGVTKIIKLMNTNNENSKK